MIKTRLGTAFKPSYTLVRKRNIRNQIETLIGSSGDMLMVVIIRTIRSQRFHVIIGPSKS
uniref:Uncharacterized protein n=1 Tax=Arundo donax TaxID=35708 RepID=A0A0A9FVC9_ARUDO